MHCAGSVRAADGGDAAGSSGCVSFGGLECEHVEYCRRGAESLILAAQVRGVMGERTTMSRSQLKV